MISKADIKNGDVVFTCKVSIETEGYYADHPPIQPWAGKVEVVSRGAIYVRRFDCQTGQADDDSNATSLVSEQEIFKTFDEAWAWYVLAAQDAVRTLIIEANDIVMSSTEWARVDLYNKLVNRGDICLD